MKKISVKFLVVIVTAIQIAGLLAPGFAEAKIPEDDAMVISSSVKKVQGLSTVMVTVKSGLAEQVKMVVEVARLATSFKDSNSPSPEKKKPAEDRTKQTDLQMLANNAEGVASRETITPQYTASHTAASIINGSHLRSISFSFYVFLYSIDCVSLNISICCPEEA